MTRARDRVEHFLDRIARLDPSLNAIRCLADDSRARADACDAMPASGPLHGRVVLVKDNVAVAGLPLTAGARALAGFRPRRDATIVARLRAAGAIVLGKTNLTEFADYVGETMPAEFSGLGGVVRHPFGARYDRGFGSSVGSACAMAAGLCDIAIGSETQNSIQTPAAASMVVGLKPTVGLVSRAGIVPLAISQDTAGPICATVADAALALQVLAGADLEDTLTLASAGRGAVASVAGALRLGVARDVYFGRAGHGEADGIVEAAIGRIAASGVTIVDPVDIPSARLVADLRSCVFRSEFKAALGAFFAAQGAPVADMAELVAWNRAHPEAIPFGQGLMEAALETGLPLDHPSYRADRARDIALTRSGGIDAALSAQDLDAIIVPGGAAAKMTGKAGYPALTVPVGRMRDGQGVGMTLIGRAWSEARLLAAGLVVERAMPVARPEL